MSNMFFVVRSWVLRTTLTIPCMCRQGLTDSPAHLPVAAVGANTGCQVNVAVFTDWHWFTRQRPMCSMYWKLGDMGLPFWANSETNGFDAAESHGGRVTHLCGAERALQLHYRQVEQKVHTEAGRRYGTCAGPRKQWIGKIIITLLRFLKTPVPTRDHRERTTVTVRRPASTWAGRFTPSTHRRPWEPWNRPAFLTLFPLTVYPCGTIQVCLSFIILRASTSSLSRRLLATVTRGNRADITSLFPGWKPPSLTHTPGKDSGQVFLPNHYILENQFFWTHNNKQSLNRRLRFDCIHCWLSVFKILFAALAYSVVIARTSESFCGL